MLLKVEALGGYILEEVLAYLLAQNGYRLLIRAEDDPDSLRQAGHGLLVRGRGADHQADALGELLLPSPFSLPVRLFVEAKFRKSKVTLTDVRNAHGVLTDVNESFGAGPASENGQSILRFQYRYSLFSTSGFASDAQGFALAHHISLIDLSGPAFTPLVNSIRLFADNLLRMAKGRALKSFPVYQAREALRSVLPGSAAGQPSAGEFIDAVEGETAIGSGLLGKESLLALTSEFAAHLLETPSGEGLVLGFPAAPFILIMQPDDIEQFSIYIAGMSTIDVTIRFSRDGSHGGNWVMRPKDQPQGFALRFGLPGGLETVLLRASDGSSRPRLASIGKSLLADISIFMEDRLVRLRYEPAPELVDDFNGPHASRADRAHAPIDATANSPLREQLKAGWEPPGRNKSSISPKHYRHENFAGEKGWNIGAARSLMSSLESGGYPQWLLLRHAMGSGPTISRDMVYSITNFPPTRSLRGLTRPTNRLTAELIEGGLLSPEVQYPITTVYDSGPVATRFKVAEELLEMLRQLSPE